MLSTVVASAIIGFGSAPVTGSIATMYDPKRDPRPVATLPGPTINGRVWVGRPAIGPRPGPVVPQFKSPGPEYYGALDNIDARVPVRVGHQVVAISPWEKIDKPGLRRFEEARQFWLNENNYTGGVRSFVNDLHIWELPPTLVEYTPTDPGQAPTEMERGTGLPPPRATIRIPGELPRQRRPLRVEGEGGSSVVTVTSDARYSWPMAAPADAVQRTTPGPAVAEAR
jgi:hypothetical protein